MIQQKQLSTLFLLLTYVIQSHCTIIVLEYAGDISHAGRAVGDYFERGITLQMVHHLQKKLTAIFPTATFVIIDPLCKHTHQEKATQTNTLQPKLVIQLHAYEKNLGSSECDIFYYITSTHEEPLKKNPEQLIRTERIHQISLSENKLYAGRFFDLTQKQSSPLTFNQPLAFPFAPLSLYAVPAIALEIGLIKNDLEPIVDILTTLIAQLAKI